MSARAIREFDGKRLVNAHIEPLEAGQIETVRLAQLKLDLTIACASGQSASSVAVRDPITPVEATSPGSDSLEGLLSAAELRHQLGQKLNQLESENGWLHTTRLVVKPDQLLKRRGKCGLILLDADWKAARLWIEERAGQEIVVGSATGRLKSFLIEPFVPHAPKDEYYVCIHSTPTGDEILFCPDGGVEVGDVDSKARRLFVPIDVNTGPAQKDLTELVQFAQLGGSTQLVLTQFIARLFRVYADLHFTYLEINPLVIVNERVYIMDMAAKLDQTAEYECSKKWTVGGRVLEFPPPFGREQTIEEAYIAELDAKTGASLKLTILNRNGRIWTMVAGGGASVAYSDAIANLGFAHEMANYGEYSGAPSENQTFEYSRTLLDLMTRGAAHPAGKILFIGGSIANFTNVAATFRGIIRALQQYRHRLVDHRVSIYVRRGGPNYQEGLKMMRDLGDSLGVPIHVFGPETHITAIVPMALQPNNYQSPPLQSNDAPPDYGNGLLGQQVARPSSAFSVMSTCSSGGAAPVFSAGTPEKDGARGQPSAKSDPRQRADGRNILFDTETRAFVFGMQAKAVQSMLDFDYACKREKPSVAGMIYPFGGEHVQKFYWGSKEILVPVYACLVEACRQHPEVDVVVNFASYRSAPETCREIIQQAPTIRTIAIIAEGIPERHTKRINALARAHRVNIVGPATVGGLRAGAFKIGNTGGMIDNIISSRLYRPGSVCYVSKSGGLSNELNNIISRHTNGVLEGIAIGGDRFPGSGLLDHVLRYEQDPSCKLILMLGEVGGLEEHRVAEAIREGRITKPLIAWCIGTCAGQLDQGGSVQFGHAGAMANSDRETATAKNAALREAGAIVPETFEAIPAALQNAFESLVKSGAVVLGAEPELPKVPLDYSWAQELGLVRKPAQFVSTICDDRGQELLYAGMPISAVFKEAIGIGGVVSLLWFRRRLPEWAGRFIEMVLMLTADHGPAVSGAHNAIVTARAGKDLVSSLASGLLTIGDRFGGALDGAAEQFSSAYDQGLSPADFVESMRKQHKLIMGIGHRIKSRTNPDLRVTILKDYARASFPATPLFDWALRVEELTTAKKDNLILNVDGAIAVLFVDLLRHSGAFSRAEADEYIKIGTLNGLFVLGRSIGFVGHYLDQRRLKQGLYRHPWDDISYLIPEQPRYQN